MTTEQMAGLAIIVGFYGSILALALKVFGLRRVLWFFVLLAGLGISIAFKSLDVITGYGRRD